MWSVRDEVRIYPAVVSEVRLLSDSWRMKPSRRKPGNVQGTWMDNIGHDALSDGEWMDIDGSRRVGLGLKCGQCGDFHYV